MPSASSTPSAATDSGSPLLHPSMVLGAYLEPLVRGRRVAILGDATIGLAERLVQRGARLVHAYDPDAARVAEALALRAPSRQAHPSYAVLADDLGVRDGAFDAVVIPDLSLFPDPADVLRRARRLVEGGGAVVIASPNAEAGRSLVAAEPSRPVPERRAALDYYALYDIVSLQFRVVRMLGQAPFVGYTVADFAQEGEPEVSIDTSLLSGSEEPEWFIAVASERPVQLDPFSVVEIPFADLLPRGAAPAAALAEVEARAARLEVELSDLRALQEREREGAEAGSEARAEAAAAAAARMAELEAELTEKGARFKELEARAGDAHVRAERLGHRIRDLEEELRSQRDRAAKLAKQLDEEKKVRTKIELELGMIRNKPEIAGAKDRIDALGAELEAARARGAELEAAARARIAELETRPLKAAPDPALMLRLEELESAVATAKREIARVSADRDSARTHAEDRKRAHEELTRTNAELTRAHAELTRAYAELKRAHEELKRAHEGELGAHEEQLRAHEERRGSLEARVAELERRNTELSSKTDAGDPLGAEVAALEAALRERGKIIAALQAELRESERVGKELVDELGDLFDASVPGEGAPEVLRRQLDTLANTAARCEADLHAATWRITQLERDLAEARVATDDGAVNAEPQPTSSESDPPREVVEQSVLLHQVSGATP